MRVPLSWLREFAPTDLPVDELAERLTLGGVKVESVLYPWFDLDGVIVARVIDVRDHPNSEKLCLARVDVGSGEQEVVVGVRNMAPGDLVPLAGPGARVPGLGEPVGAREIRGVVSNGMLCSPRELAIGQDHGGILILNDEGLEPGADLKASLGLDEVVLDIEVEPNRPDFLSVIGVAREVAAITGVALHSIAPTLEEGSEDAAPVVSVTIEAPDGCPRYIARVIRGAGAGPSPLAAQIRLTAAGMRPISAVVDATNYVMLELGQPLHGFDMDRLAGPGIVVRRAAAGEKLRTLDDVERTLDEDDLLICDLKQPVAIAGVMGGATSEVSDATADVLLESAYFTRTGILRTARRLDLHSEASYRFERGTDPEGLEAAAARCAGLISSWTGATVLRGAATAGELQARRWVSMRPARASALLGYQVSSEDASEVFERLGMAVKNDSEDRLDVESPGYRVDLEREVDLIEEVVRLQGYDRVGATLPRPSHPGGMPEPYAFVRTIREALVRAGLREVRPIPFCSAEDVDMTGDADAIAIANPISVEEGFLRTRLTPGLLHIVASNQARGVRRISLFEVGTVFRLADPVQERRKVAFALSGSADEGWAAAERELDVLDARGVLESLMEELGVASWSLGDALEGPFHPGRSASITVEGARAGVLGEIHPRLARSLDISGRVAVGELEFDALLDAAGKAFVFHDVPRFPPLRRDLAFVVPDGAAAGDVHAAIMEAGGALVDRCVLFDVFRGGSLPPGTKSLAFAVDFRAPDRTLTDDEAEVAVAAIVQRLRDLFGGELRTG
ncbi:MAG: phenylalanine--tRNA ligase subunit beta [Actinomycetota bacterium]|nr:phenylalanine--tRNA ligase subunit beta [Actinomycetota bacterium]